MQPEDILNRVREVATVRQVFGEPYESDGTLVVPVARIWGGGGGGTGNDLSGGTEKGRDGQGGGFGIVPASRGLRDPRGHGHLATRPGRDPHRAPGSGGGHRGPAGGAQPGPTPAPPPVGGRSRSGVPGSSAGAGPRLRGCDDGGVTGWSLAMATPQGPRPLRILPLGEVSEWLMVPLSKSGVVNSHRGFESRPLRHPSCALRCRWPLGSRPAVRAPGPRHRAGPRRLDGTPPAAIATALTTTTPAGATPQEPIGHPVAKPTTLA